MLVVANNKQRWFDTMYVFLVYGKFYLFYWIRVLDAQ